MQLILTREVISPDGVFGTLRLPGYELKTMEDDWKFNQPRESCIPAGSYLLLRTIYYKRRIETFEVTGVPGRSRILIHPANTEEDVEGCIGLGLRYGKLYIAKDEDTGEAKIKQAVVASQSAFKRFMDTMSGVDNATLEIRWLPGLP